MELLKAALAAYDQMIGLDLDDLSLDGSITKSTCGGELSGLIAFEGVPGVGVSVAG